MKFNKIFKDLRAETSLSQKDIAEELSVSRSVVSDWEQGRTEPSIQGLIDIADYYAVSVDYLIGRDSPREHILTIQQKELLDAFNALNRDKQQQVIGFCKALNYLEYL
ncbi:MAG: helix-turn-helix transcriptional regulator [Clostridia bacterium]|nr:helix-turn-helix transcriptional regulator [Clostridia bacterium]